MGVRLLNEVSALTGTLVSSTSFIPCLEIKTYCSPYQIVTSRVTGRKCSVFVFTNFQSENRNILPPPPGYFVIRLIGPVKMNWALSISRMALNT
jgi:hypothetical protein